MKNNLEEIEKLKLELKNSDLSMKKIAEKLGVSRTTLYEWIDKYENVDKIKNVAGTTKVSQTFSHNKLKGQMQSTGNFKDVQFNEFSSSIIDSYKSVIESQKQIIDSLTKQVEAANRNHERVADKLDRMNDAVLKISLTMSQHHEDAREYISMMKRELVKLRD